MFRAFWQGFVHGIVDEWKFQKKYQYRRTPAKPPEENYDD